MLYPRMHDATAPARILAKYAKQFPALELIAGVVEGNYNDQAGIQALSTIPSREELLGKLLGSMQSLCRQLHVAGITQQLLRQLRHSALRSD